MKNILLAAIVLLVLYITSCKEGQDNTMNNQRMTDTIFKLYPTVNGATANVQDNQDVIITIRDKESYNATEARQLEMVNNIAGITYTIYNEGNWLKSGKVIFTETENSIHNDQAKDKTYDMHLEDIVNANKK